MRRLLNNKKIMLCFRLAPFLLCVGLAVAILVSDRELSAEMILSYTPENPVLAALVILLFYALKSLSIVFPFMPIQISCGILFPTAAAVIVNMLGVSVSLTISYWIGHLSGMGFVEKIAQKYPKFEQVIRYQNNNSFFTAFFLRIIRCLPFDVVSMYLGASDIPFYKYFLAGLLGAFPGTLMSTLIGAGMDDPASPMFWISIIVTVLLSVGSSALYYLWKRKIEKPAP